MLCWSTKWNSLFASAHSTMMSPVIITWALPPSQLLNHQLLPFLSSLSLQISSNIFNIFNIFNLFKTIQNYPSKWPVETKPPTRSSTRVTPKTSLSSSMTSRSSKSGRVTAVFLSLKCWTAGRFSWLTRKCYQLLYHHGRSLTFVYSHGAQGVLDTASQSALQNEFGTTKDDECMVKILEGGEYQATTVSISSTVNQLWSSVY